MIQIDFNLKPEDLTNQLKRFWELSGEKISLIEKEYERGKGSPVFTSEGKYTTRGWTEWTQGFQFGSSILQFDATGEKDFLENGRANTLELMAPHVSHTGVHRSEEHTSELQSRPHLVCRLLLEKKKKK